MAEISLAVKTETAEELQESVLNLATIMGGQTAVKANVADPHATPEPEPKQKKKKTAAKKEQTEDKAASTEKTSEEKASSIAKEKTALKEDKEPEKSITEGQHPNATKADVQAAMKKAMEAGHRPEIKTAFGRFNAGKLSDLKEEDYSAFITDLEALIATAGD